MGTHGSRHATPIGAAADQLRRRRVVQSLGERLEVLINGRRCPVWGGSAWTSSLVDLGPRPLDVAEGDRSIWSGRASGGEPTAQDWSRSAPSTARVVTSPRGRITRTYREAENR